ncbi:hypothetical protein COLO4_35150 [Corchorus olitorius]|uniref:Uncharacterized protein n=1 Tax=Corchorus olitorius TaxID=93759 RepID=A0A1R3GI37_9ROSI|nr:hypothetical protein COLO4_35150 [Corchorus olitorius]
MALFVFFHSFLELQLRLKLFTLLLMFNLAFCSKSSLTEERHRKKGD